MKQPKAENFKIRASTLQKRKLEEAARILNLDVSQFVLNKSLEAAEQVIAEQTTIRVSVEEYDWLVSNQVEPRRDQSKLRELLAKPSVFEQ